MVGVLEDGINGRDHGLQSVVEEVADADGGQDAQGGLAGGGTYRGGCGCGHYPFSVVAQSFAPPCPVRRPFAWDAEFGDELNGSAVSLHRFAFPFSGKNWDSLSVGATGSISFGGAGGGRGGG